jgi:hypothetical protein
MDPDGACWDEPFCTDPDPIVTVSVDGRILGQTSEAGGSYTNTWGSEPIGATLTAGAKIELTAYDVDVDFNDFAASCMTTASVELVRSGEIRCTARAGQSTVGATIDPQP